MHLGFNININNSFDVKSSSIDFDCIVPPLHIRFLFWLCTLWGIKVQSKEAVIVRRATQKIFHNNAMSLGCWKLPSIDLSLVDEKNKTLHDLSCRLDAKTKHAQR